LLRFRAPIGSRVEATERLSLDVLRSIEKAAGPGECDDHFGLCRRTTTELPYQYDLSVDQRAARSGLARRVESESGHSSGRIRGSIAEDTATAISRVPVLF